MCKLSLICSVNKLWIFYSVYKWTLSSCVCERVDTPFKCHKCRRPINCSLVTPVYMLFLSNFKICFYATNIPAILRLAKNILLKSLCNQNLILNLIYWSIVIDSRWARFFTLTLDHSNRSIYEYVWLTVILAYIAFTHLTNLTDFRHIILLIILFDGSHFHFINLMKMNIGVMLLKLKFTVQREK